MQRLAVCRHLHGLRPGLLGRARQMRCHRPHLNNQQGDLDAAAGRHRVRQCRRRRFSRRRGALPWCGRCPTWIPTSKRSTPTARDFLLAPQLRRGDPSANAVRRQRYSLADHAELVGAPTLRLPGQLPRERLRRTGWAPGCFQKVTRDFWPAPTLVARHRRLDRTGRTTTSNSGSRCDRVRLGPPGGENTINP